MTVFRFGTPLRVVVAFAASAIIAGCSANSGANTTAGGSPGTPLGNDSLKPALTLAINPQVIQPGDTAAITWTASNATSCTASGAWTGSQAVSNTAGLTVGPITSAGVYTYGLTCVGAGGSGSSAQTLIVGTPPAPTVNLTLNPATIRPGDTASLNWSATNSSSCVGSGGSGSDGWAATQPVSPTSAFSVGPFTTAGSYSYVLSCSGAGGSASDSRILTIDVAAPAAPPTVTFSASPTQILPAGNITLTWSTTNATACTASGGTGLDAWTGSEPTSSTGLRIGPIVGLGTYTYTLTCSGAGGSQSQQATVIVTATPQTAAPTVSIDVNPTEIKAGQSANLSWTTTNAELCLASGSWAGPKATSGSAIGTGTILLPGNYSYTLLCTGPGGAATATANLTVDPAAANILTFLAVPSVIPVLPVLGTPVTLNWVTTDATSCTASGGTGSDGWGGSVPTLNVADIVGPITAAGNYTYTLKCTGAGGDSAPASVTVSAGGVALPAATVLTFTAIPATVTAGQSTTLTWTSLNATSCTASGGTGSDGWSGSVPALGVAYVVGPIATQGPQTYTLTCTGAGGPSAPSSLTVTVNPPPPGSPTVTITANDANPAQVQPGNFITLKWTSTNAATCVASGGTGSDGWAGVRATSSSGTTVGPATVPGVYTYTINCTGLAGSASASVPVTVIVSSTADCGIGVPSTALLASAASASGGVSGVCLLGCSVTNLPRLVDSDATNFATISMNVGVGATGTVKVTDSAASFPAGRQAGFLIAPGNAQLAAGLLQNVTVRTLQGGTIQESSTVNNNLSVGAAGLLPNPNEGFVGFTTTKPFDSIQLDVTAPASLLSTFNVYNACVSLQ